MKRDVSLILIAALIGLVMALILFRGCGNLHPSSDRVDVQKIYDSIEVVINSQLPPPDTIVEVREKEVVRWLPGATVRDTIIVEGETVYVYNDAEIDTNAILTHFLTQATTYIDTIRDSSLQAVISDTIFRNQITGRGFKYKILRPVQYIDHRDKFQLIASFQAGGGMTYANAPQSIYAGVDLGFKFKSGTYFSVGYMAGSGHFMTIRAGQVIRFKKFKPKMSLIP
jgi:hypothetical protein